MKKYLFLMLSFFILSASLLEAQQLTKEETKAARKAAKEKAKQEQEAYDQLMFQKAYQAIESKEFILEADMIYLKRGQSFPVSSTVNFISVNGDKAVVQIASNAAFGGPNGMGGITVEGTTRNVALTKDKKGIVRLKMDVSGIALSAQVEIILYGGSNRAEATVYPNFNSRRMTLNGRVLPLQESKYYKSGFSY